MWPLLIVSVGMGTSQSDPTDELCYYVSKMPTTINSYLVSQSVHLIFPQLTLGEAFRVQSCWDFSVFFSCLNTNSFCLIWIEHLKCNNNKPEPEGIVHVPTHALRTVCCPNSSAHQDQNTWSTLLHLQRGGEAWIKSTSLKL